MSRRSTTRRSALTQQQDRAHAPGKQKLGPPPNVERLRGTSIRSQRHQPWSPTSGLVGRKRRSARRS